MNTQQMKEWYEMFGGKAHKVEFRGENDLYWTSPTLNGPSWDDGLIYRLVPVAPEGCPAPPEEMIAEAPVVLRGPLTMPRGSIVEWKCLPIDGWVRVSRSGLLSEIYATTNLEIIRANRPDLFEHEENNRHPLADDIIKYVNNPDVWQWVVKTYNGCFQRITFTEALKGYEYKNTVFLVPKRRKIEHPAIPKDWTVYECPDGYEIQELDGSVYVTGPTNMRLLYEMLQHINGGDRENPD